MNKRRMVWSIFFIVLPVLSRAESQCNRDRLMEFADDACQVIRFLKKTENSVHLSQRAALIAEVSEPLQRCEEHAPLEGAPVGKIAKILDSLKRSPSQLGLGLECLNIENSLGDVSRWALRFRDLGFDLDSEACPSLGASEEWKVWAQKRLMRKLEWREDSLSRREEILKLLKSQDPLITLFAGSSLNKILLLSQVLQIPEIYPRSEWNRWLPLTLQSVGSWISDEKFKDQLDELKKRVQKMKEVRQVGREPLVFIPVDKASVDWIKREKLQLEKNRLESSRPYQDCLGDNPSRSIRSKCYHNILEHELAGVMTRIQNETQSLEDLLYSQVIPADQRGFPYGFSTRTEFLDRSQTLLKQMREGLCETFLKESSPGLSSSCNATSQASQDLIQLRFSGSAASGLSFSPKAQGRMRKVFDRHSDFDLAVTLSDEAFRKVYSLFAEAQQQHNTTSGKKVIRMPDSKKKTRTFPIGVNALGDPIGSGYCEDPQVAHELLQKLGILQAVRQLAKESGREVNLMFHAQSSMDRKEPGL
ncbi:MAG: hypothetical protein ACO3A2_08180 [Bdellovibrionia bacterium]